MKMSLAAVAIGIISRLSRSFGRLKFALIAIVGDRRQNFAERCERYSVKILCNLVKKNLFLN
jgi:hypothetical protein